MDRRRLWCGILLFGMFAPTVLLLAAEDSVEWIPQGFTSYLVVDRRYASSEPMAKKDDRDRTGKLHNLINENGLYPVVMVFSRTVPTEATHPLVPLIKKLQELQDVPRYRAARLGTFVIFLTLEKPFQDDPLRDIRITEVKKFSETANVVMVPFGLAESDSEAVKAFKIAPEDDITVIAYNRLKVVQRWKFSKDSGPSATELDEIAAAVNKMIPGVSTKPKAKR